MSLANQLMSDMKDAMRSKDRVKLDVVRFLRSDIKNWEIDNGPADDTAIQKIIAKQVKQIKEANADYAKAGRTDLVKAEEEKLKVLMTYLPAQLDEADIIQIIDQVIAQNSDLKMGPLVGQVMKEVKGQADGATVSKLVAQRLNQS